MKLIFCPECHDIIKLDYGTRHCKCGKSCGFYHDDGAHATVSGDAVCIGIDNITFAKAFNMMHDNPKLAYQSALDLLNFRAWVFHPRHAERVEYKE